MFRGSALDSTIPLLTGLRFVGVFGVLGSFASCSPAAAPAREGGPESPLFSEVYKWDQSDGSNFRPNPNVQIQTPRFAIKRSKLTREGEVLIIEGDGQTVAPVGPNSWGISENNKRAIVQRVLAEYPDVFDTIQIFTTFQDDIAGGSAYYQSIRNSVNGIGVMTFNGRGGWGLPAEGGRLSGFSDMNSMLVWGNGSLVGLERVGSSYHAVIAQELSHKWLFRFRFAGPNPQALIGRDDAHWSRLANSEASVQDGVRWTDNGDGSFTNGGNDENFAPLDLYAMGFIGAEEVPDFFYIDNAMQNGEMLAKTQLTARGSQVTGDRVDVTMDMVLEEMGPRNPPVGTETPYYRAAFVLITAPDEPRSSWEPHLTKLQQVGQTFPESWRLWAGGRGALCTKVSERCPEPVMRLGGSAIEDGGDQLIAPGESFGLRLSLLNEGLGLAENVEVELSSEDPNITINTNNLMGAPVPEGQVVPMDQLFMLEVGNDVACGDSIAMRAKFTTQEGPIFFADFTLGVGTKSIRFDPLNEAPDWTINPDGDDTAVTGAWSLGAPEFTSVLGVVTQPGADHTPGEAKLSFHTGHEKMETFSSNDVDLGKTTLESPVFSISELRDPSLVFYYWHLATDFSQQGGPMPVPGAELVVQVSNDAGANWFELGRIEEQTEEWTRAKFRIRDQVNLSDRVQFRFIIADDTMTGTVEAGIDDLEVIDFLDECEIPGEMMMGPPPPPPPPPTEDDGGGCTATTEQRGASGLLAGWALIVLLGLLRRGRKDR